MRYRQNDSCVGINMGPNPFTGFRFSTGFYHNESMMGKRVKVVRGDCEVSRPTCLGQVGVITGWYDYADNPIPGFPVILPASCYHMAIVSGDDGQTFYANLSWCDTL